MALHKITILGKPDCHLCDVAAEVAQKVVGSNLAVIIEKVDITEDPDLLEKYKNDIPVILVDGVEKFRRGVDPAKLAQLFYDELPEKLVGF